MLATLAITQPLLSTLGENPTFFVAHSTTARQILVFTAIVSLVPAALLGALMLAGHAISTGAGGRIFYASMTVLAFVFVLQVVDVMPGPPVAVAAVAAAVSFGLMILYSTLRPVRSAVSVLSVFPVAVVALFLFGSPVTSIVFPDDLEAVALDDLVGADSAAERLAADSTAPAIPAPSSPAPADGAVASPAATGPAPAITSAPYPAPASTTATGVAPTTSTAGPDATLQPASIAERLNHRFPPIYILVLDELPWPSLLDRSGRIDEIRYPNFARLGATSHVFSNATTTAFTTEQAVPALLTGTLETQPAPVFSLYPDNLFTLLGGVYDVSSSDPLVDLCPPSVCDGSPPEQILELVAADEATRSGPNASSSATASITATHDPTTTAATTTTITAPAAATASITATHDPTTTAATTTTITAPAATTAASITLPVAERGESRERSDPGGSLSLLLTDAAIVLAHLVSPEGVDFGLPAIGAAWGDFGRGPIVPQLAGDAAPEREVSPLTATTTPPSASAATEAIAARTGAPAAIAANPAEIAATTTTATTANPATTTTAAAPQTASAGADATAALPTRVKVATPASSDPVDPQQVKEEQTAFLDSLIFNDTRVADFRTEVAVMAASELPRLHYLHILLPHVPWRFRPDGSTYADIQLPGYFSQWDEDPGTAHFGQQRHLLQLGLVDRLLGEYLDRLEAIGDFDRAIVIVTADHGISFVPGERSRGIGDGNVGGIANVPLLYKEPGQRTGTVQAQPVQLIDVVPTITAQLEVEPPWTFDGRDMFSAGPVPERRVQGPYGAVDVPGSFTATIEAIAADMHQAFGDGSTGSLYSLVGAHDLIGKPVRDWTISPSEHCWILERPATTPDPNGAVAYAYGRIAASASTRVAVALSIDGVVAGTGQSYRDGSTNRVYVIGDPQSWRGGTSVIELHEIVDERLARMARC